MNHEILLRHFEKGLAVPAGSELFGLMNSCAQQAFQITARLNGSYHTPEDIVQLMSELTGKPVDPSFRLFPPFYSEFGKGITLGKNVFINACCCFQDHGGITIGDGSFIGHNVVMATLNHGFLPEDRGSNYPAPINIGRNVWVGASSTILQGVTIGDNAVVAAGAVVSKDVEANTIVGGVPARFIKSIADAGRKQREGTIK